VNEEVTARRGPEGRGKGAGGAPGATSVGADREATKGSSAPENWKGGGGIGVKERWVIGFKHSWRKEKKGTRNSPRHCVGELLRVQATSQKVG